MSFLDETGGVVGLSDEVRLYPHMPISEVREQYARLTGEPSDEQEGAGFVAFPAFAVEGGQLAAVCRLPSGTLEAIEFSVVTVGQRHQGDADRQRALLFACLHAQDPCRDSKRGVLLRCGFGTALITTDPVSGNACLRLTYR